MLQPLSFDAGLACVEALRPGSDTLWLPPINTPSCDGCSASCPAVSPAAFNSILPIAPLLSSTTVPEPWPPSITTLRFAGSEPTASGHSALPLPVTTPPCGNSMRHGCVAPLERRAACDALLRDVDVADLREIGVVVERGIERQASPLTCVYSRVRYGA